MRSGFIALLAGSLLSACASLPPALPSHGDASTLQNWQLQGRIAIIENNESWPASIHWEQAQEDYRIELIGPLGQGRISVRGDAEQVELTTDQDRFYASDADALLTQATGLHIPINGLKYWVRGLPDPATPARLVRDGQSRIVQIEQNGWRIDYPNRVHVQSLELPKRIQAEQDDIQVKIAITTWTLPN